MRILIIDNNIDPQSWGASDLCRFARQVQGGITYVRRAPHDDLPADPSFFDRIVVSGSKTSAMDQSPWVSKLHQFIRQSIDLGKPFLGVCYGHQALACALGGMTSVRKAATPEFGWTRIELTQPDSPLTRDLPRSFYTFSSHYDEVAQLPPGMERIARSEHCEIQACQLQGKPVFGIQFHPEKSLEDAKKVLAERKKSKEPKEPKNLFHPNESDQLFDPKLGEALFRNFFQL